MERRRVMLLSYVSNNAAAMTGAILLNSCTYPLRLLDRLCRRARLSVTC